MKKKSQINESIISEFENHSKKDKQDGGSGPHPEKWGQDFVFLCLVIFSSNLNVEG